MKILLPIVLFVIIAILGCALGYEVVQKNRIGKDWNQFIITTCVRDYQDLDHGDVDKVKVDLMLIADVSAQSYVASYGHETGTKFAPSLSKAFAIYDAYQATNRSTK